MDHHAQGQGSFQIPPNHENKSYNMPASFSNAAFAFQNMAAAAMLGQMPFSQQNFQSNQPTSAWSQQMPPAQNGSLSDNSTVSVPAAVAAIVHQMQMQVPQSMPPFVTPYVSGQTSTPYVPDVPDAIGSFSNDEDILTRALYESEAKGQTYKQALESLHRVNNHAAFLWKDYYLEHKPRIDNLVAHLAPRRISASHLEFAQPKTYHSIPEPSRFRSDASSSRYDSPSSSKASRRKEKKSTTSSSKYSVPQVKPKRMTINSITTHAPVHSVYDISLPHADIRIPKPPSRSPTPPTQVIVSAHGNKYTKADKEYFIKFISWELKCNPSLSKRELCEMIAEKAPHHTATSWASYWSRFHDLPDKILAAANGDREEDEDSASSDAASGSGFVSNEDDGEESEDASDSSHASPSAKETSENDYNESDDEMMMGQAGAPITKGDKLALGRYVASRRAEWDEISSQAKWEPFHEQYPQRSYHSWAEAYRRYASDIEELMRKEKKKERKKGRELAVIKAKTPVQIARPTWAAKGSPHILPQQFKRKLDASESGFGIRGADDGPEREDKRRRQTDSEASDA